jgi:hypothetical protein
MWSRILSDTGGSGLFPEDSLLSFGELRSFELDRGIQDSAWLKREEDTGRIAGESEVSGDQLSLLV